VVLSLRGLTGSVLADAAERETKVRKIVMCRDYMPSVCHDDCL
jgi:hypothetical protein